MMTERKENNSTMFVLMQLIILMTFILMIAAEKEMIKREEERQQRQEIEKQLKEADCLEEMCAGVERIFEEIRVIEVAADHRIEEGFVYYEIPEEYRKTGGSLSKEIQEYTYSLCMKEKVKYSLIIAMIEKESGYKTDCIGDKGESMGYMQITPKWYEEKMKELGITDLFNPYQNIRLGVDIMKELVEKYGTVQEALAVYNYGEKGAREHLWDNGTYVYSYNREIMQRMKEIEEVVGDGI